MEYKPRDLVYPMKERHTYLSVLGRLEFEMLAESIIRYCWEKNEWQPVALNEIPYEYRLFAGDMIHVGYLAEHKTLAQRKTDGKTDDKTGNVERVLLTQSALENIAEKYLELHEMKYV